MLSDNLHIIHKQTLLREHENFLSMHWILCGENLIPCVDLECLFCISFKCLRRDHLHVHHELIASSTKKPKKPTKQEIQYSRTVFFRDDLCSQFKITKFYRFDYFKLSC